MFISYEVSLELIRNLRPIVPVVKRFDGDLADQMHRAATSICLNLAEGALAASWECLAKVGNLSSASVLLVLEDFMGRRRPEPGTLSILAAMGPGFCSELVLLRW